MRYLFRLALVVCVASSIGCLPASTSPTGSSTSGTGPISQGTMSATIGSAPWTASARVTATYSPAQGGVGTAILSLSGQDSPLTEMLTFSIGALTPGTDLTLGTYQVGTTGTNANLMDGVGNTYQASGLVGTGTVTLNTFSTTARTASGTFNFIMLQNGTGTTRAVANGSFAVMF